MLVVNEIKCRYGNSSRFQSRWSFLQNNTPLSRIMCRRPSRYYPADTDVFRASSGRLKKVMTSYDQTRRLQDVRQKTSYLRRLGDVWFTTFWRRRIYVVLRTSAFRRFEEVWFTTSWRRLIYHFLMTYVKRRLWRK